MAQGKTKKVRYAKGTNAVAASRTTKLTCMYNHIAIQFSLNAHMYPTRDKEARKV
ncbi:hypothetical protein M7I_7862 [Glarea lozoyensis 74030]|uniref:Uncharacterized protein n=1 Tax=Glarea lozoyensis (strain ATCC 74030 / MF5533) TaxID=1104152 RepID=H0EYG0_GLAL7|nr:hypothetical protein M7I_7862 [Glarea lozoyensis 74030]